jgi:hypothetical protein
LFRSGDAEWPVSGVAMGAVDVQVITYAPTAFYHCQHCEIAFGQIGLGATVHREQAREALPADLLDDFARLSDVIRDLNERFGDRVRIRIVDAASFEGFFKSLRFRTMRYPAVVIDGQKCDVTPGYDNLTTLVEAAAGAAGDEGVTTKTVRR